MAAEATGWWVGRMEGGEAAAAAAAATVVVVAGEPFGSDNGKHSFSLRVSVHQCRGPGGGRGAGFVSSRLTLGILMVMPRAPSSQVVQQIKWAVFKPQVPRERQSEATRRLTVESGRTRAFADSFFLFSGRRSLQDVESLKESFLLASKVIFQLSP